MINGIWLLFQQLLILIILIANVNVTGDQRNNKQNFFNVHCISPQSPSKAYKMDHPLLNRQDNNRHPRNAPARLGHLQVDTNQSLPHPSVSGTASRNTPRLGLDAYKLRSRDVDALGACKQLVAHDANA